MESSKQWSLLSQLIKKPPHTKMPTVVRKYRRKTKLNTEKQLWLAKDTIMVWWKATCHSNELLYLTIFPPLGSLSHKLYKMGKYLPWLSSGISSVSRNRSIAQEYFKMPIAESALQSVNVKKPPYQRTTWSGNGAITLLFLSKRSASSKEQNVV